MAFDCSIDRLLNDSKCIAECIPQGSLPGITAYLWCRINGANPNLQTELSSSSCYVTCIGPQFLDAAEIAMYWNYMEQPYDPQTLVSFSACYQSCMPHLHQAIQVFILATFASVSIDPQDLLTAAGDFIRITEDQASAICVRQMQIYRGLPSSIDNILADAKCIAACMTPGIIEAIKTRTICEFVNTVI